VLRVPVGCSTPVGLHPPIRAATIQEDDRSGQLMQYWTQRVPLSATAVCLGLQYVGYYSDGRAPHVDMGVCWEPAHCLLEFTLSTQQESQRKVALLEAMVTALRERLHEEEARTSGLRGGQV
jgi:hypothetical protein